MQSLKTRPRKKNEMALSQFMSLTPPLPGHAFSADTHANVPLLVQGQLCSRFLDDTFGPAEPDTAHSDLRLGSDHSTVKGAHGPPLSWRCGGRTFAGDCDNSHCHEGEVLSRGLCQSQSLSDNKLKMD